MPTLKLTLVEGKNLPIADLKSSDPYVKMKTERSEVKSAIIKQNHLHPVWNETFVFEIDNPKLSSMELKVFDWDRLSADDEIGQYKILSFANFKKGVENDLWVNLTLPSCSKLSDPSQPSQLHVKIIPLDFGKE
nr:unnamed protein product [Naegleria fowleri]